MKSICLMLILIGHSTVQCLTCNEVLDLPLKKQLTFQELTSMLPKDINDCLPHLARKALKITHAQFIWRTLIDFYNGIPNIPENILVQLHWVTVAVTPEDYANITISSIDTVKNFGLYYNLDHTQLEAIADRVREDFAGKMPEDYTYYDLKALNQILCAFNRTEIERIHPAAYKEAALFIGKLRNCHTDVLAGFANLAIHEDAFGPLDKWSGAILETVGRVADYVPGGISKELRKKLEAEEHETERYDDSHDDFKLYNTA